MTAMGPSMGLVEQEETAQAEPDDEITNLLLRWLSTSRSLKSTHTAHMCGGPKKVGRTKKLVD